MNRKKILYGIILDIWELLKIAQKHECEKLTDSEWELFDAKSRECRSKYMDMGKEYDMLFRSLFAVIENYYEKNGE